MKKYLIPVLSLLLAIACTDHNTDPGSTDDDQNGPTENNDVRMWLTTQSKVYMMKELPIKYSNDITDVVLRLDPTVKYQTIDGFGGGLTGSSAYLLQQMSAEARAKVLKELFDPKEGAGLESLRLCIGASDFSMALYTYCDKEGIENFAIPEIDKRDLLPVLKEILAINPKIKLIASPWSPPAWMKSSGQLNKGKLKGPEVYDAYATYFVKYVEAMKAEGITIDAITLQNEADFESGVHPSMKMSWQEQAEIIGKYLGPKFKTAGITTKILILDHNFDIYSYAINVLRDATANQYIAGTAFHGYAGNPSAINPVKAEFPDKSIYETELSGGGWNTGTEMETLFYYLTDFLVPCIQNGSSNYMMFNVALNSQHGPVTPGGVFCEDCRGIVTIDGDVYKKELEYYLLGHFGKVCRSGAKMISTSFLGTLPDGVTATAFLNPDGSKGLVIVNKSGNSINLTVKDQATSKRFVYNVPNLAIASFILK
ncbi:glucan endo-1,6-beta-glucosidase [Dysgonomonas mossii]|uniref:Glucan endo-1,6-beta-glucosidase n=1 Tax=Dysgonomonas mossii TaxID=163665 RepID=A0A4Y9IN15_9BACT|nr:glycoside hydrolase family 30 beta sandwich domain-containing protein [Dysgonomonas mossii]MBF0761517.1 glucan endo-1,6-beta-glucosidase [Dysgonomonas mossii]TFU89154.1 glucan endo-1,6-beta-glucosidase [Dysgonomonas mossii]